MASIVVCRYLFQSALQSVIEGHQIYELTAQQVKDGAVKVNKYYSSVELKLEIAVFLGEPDLGWCRTIPMLEIPTPQPVSERVDRQGIVHDVGCTRPHKGACACRGLAPPPHHSRLACAAMQAAHARHTGRRGGWQKEIRWHSSGNGHARAQGQAPTQPQPPHS